MKILASFVIELLGILLIVSIWSFLVRLHSDMLNWVSEAVFSLCKTWTIGSSPLQCESNRILNQFEAIWINPDQSGLGRFYTSLSLLEANRFRDITHRYRHLMNTPHPFVWKRWILHNFWRCSTAYSIVSSEGWIGRCCKEFERKKEQNELSRTRRKPYRRYACAGYSA